MNLKAGLLYALDRYLGPLDKRCRIFEWRKRHCLELQRRSGFAEAAEPEPIPTLEAAELTAERFTELSRRYRRPVLIRGLMRDTEACHRWGLDFFADSYGDDVYPVVADSRREDAAQRRTEFTMASLREVMEGIRRGGSFQYVNNLTKIFTDHPELIRQMELPRLLVALEDEATDECFEAVNMFIGGRGTGSNLHHAFAGNFFTNLVGRKQWTLIDPKYSPYLLPIPSRPFFFSDAYFDPILDERSEFSRRLPFHRVVLEPGDVLYNAPWWWHAVRNVDDFTVGCAVRCSRLRADLANSALSTLMCEEYKLLVFKVLFNTRKKLTGDQKIFREAVHEQLDEDIFFQEDEAEHFRPGSTPARLVSSPRETEAGR